jgi:hypothetical protein
VKRVALGHGVSSKLEMTPAYGQLIETTRNYSRTQAERRDVRSHAKRENESLLRIAAKLKRP